MDVKSEIDGETFKMSSHSEIKVTDPLQTELPDTLSFVSVKSEEEDDAGDGMEDGLKVVEMVEQVEVNVIVEDHGTYLEDMNGVRWYFANTIEVGAEQVCYQEEDSASSESVSQNNVGKCKNVANGTCLECGGKLNIDIKNGPAVCVKCTVGASEITTAHTESLSKVYKTHECTICTQQFTSFVDLRRHSLSHKKTGASVKVKKPKTLVKKNVDAVVKCKRQFVSQYSCEICKRTFSSLHTLKKHNVVHVGIQASKDTGLSKKCQTKDQSNSGKESIKSQQLLLICPACMEKFSTCATLKQHFNIHEKGGPFKCSLCSQHLVDKSELEVHSIVHNRMKKPYVCDACNKLFKTLSCLRTHTYIHLKKKEYPCKKCNKSYALQKQLKRHEMSHGINLYTCDACFREFKRLGHLKRHYCPQRRRLNVTYEN